MQLITQTFYLLSNALLVPVLVVLLVCFLRTLVQAGRVLQEYLARQHFKTARQHLEECLVHDADSIPLTSQQPELQDLLTQLLARPNDLPSLAFQTERTELGWQRALDVLRSLVKLGPGLGLMGTLIPLGPALVGLAVGDIQTMSNNLVIAFSTTVLGLFVGLAAGFLVTLKRQWQRSDSALLNLFVERVSLRSAAGQPLWTLPTEAATEVSQGIVSADKGSVPVETQEAIHA